MSAPCDRPIEPAALADYWFGEAEASEAAIENHLIECDWCSSRLDALRAIGEGVRRLAHGGAIEMVVTPSFLEQVRREGLRIREYRVPPAGTALCTVAAQDDLLVGHIEADLRGVSRVDLVWFGHGAPERRILDVPFKPDAGELILVQSMPFMRGLGVTRSRLHVVAQDPQGERLLGEYSFQHTPSL